MHRSSRVNIFIAGANINNVELSHKRVQCQRRLIKTISNRLFASQIYFLFYSAEYIHSAT